MRHAMLIVGLAAVSACSMEPETPSPSPSGSGSAVSVGGTMPGAMNRPSASPAPLAVAARSEKISNDLIEFEYTYPATAGALPTLKAWLDQDLETHKRDVSTRAKAQQAEAKKEGYPFNPFGYWSSWKTVTDLPGWLSLSAEISTYEGGAHPNHGFNALIWDKQADRRRDPISLFTSKAALGSAIRSGFCRELDKQRVKKRGGDGKLGGGISEFDTCVDPLNSTLILGSSNGKAFNRIGILVPPYEAGPYAEGSYEVTLPVTDAVMAAVKPEFRPTFVAAK